MPNYTIIEEGHYCKLQQDGRTVAVISDCDEGAAIGFAIAINSQGKLRNALSRVASAVGGFASPDCSVEFLSEDVPREVELVISRLKQQRDGLLAALENIRSMVDTDDPESYRSDDREGCLDAVFSAAAASIAEAERTHG